MRFPKSLLTLTTLTAMLTAVPVALADPATAPGAADSAVTTAGASPPGQVDGNPIGFTATTVDRAAVIDITGGAIRSHDGVLTIEALDHTVLAGAELSFRVDDFVFPIDAEVHDRTAKLTPRFDLDHAVYSPVALPFEDSADFKSPYQRERDAWARMTSTIATGAVLGTVVGGLGGAAVGCVLGGITGGGLAAATLVGIFGPFLPAAAIGCLAGIAAVGAIGAVAGQLLVTAPVAILAAIQYFATITAPLPAP
ncbi:hypothetical protein [Nocardia sp. NPDC052566]|uniref:hypothetical protein n=1 Tax=Nocardia sp. NPDC052566 TaxID=3364330 RepID=UPI0037CC49E3